VAEKRPALGRGLSALIPEAPPAAPAPQAAPAPAKDLPPTEVDLDLIAPNPYQPRLNFDEAKLEELAQSIRANGLIQPIIVRRSPAAKPGAGANGVAQIGAGQTGASGPSGAAGAGAKAAPYEIIAGERRWRAAQRAGLLRVPVLVKDVPDDKLLEVALIENIQREDLNPIDEALAYRKLIDDFKLTQEALATAVGKDRSSVANFLRLLKLPDSVRKDVATGTLSMGHARALLAIENEAALEQAARDVVERKLSVRETEALAKKANEPAPVEDPNSAKIEEAAEPPDVHTRKAEETMRLALGTRVHIKRKGKAGRIEIEFVNEDELHRLYEYITERR
jgi:ParB family transcriptional regulator, chromosome partitioning protein